MERLKLEELFENTPEITFTFINLTNGFSINGEVEIISISRDGCGLNLPKASCSLGDNVALTFLIQSKDQIQKKIEIEGKVLGVGPFNEKNNEMKVQYHQFVKEEWELVLKLFKQKQTQISQVLNTMRTPQS